MGTNLAKGQIITVDINNKDSNTKIHYVGKIFDAKTRIYEDGTAEILLSLNPVKKISNR